ncbi:DNA-binding response regulator [Terrihabitans soli]|uniref:DNA-binding response regulator n=1 Tax=Terrihabitans soli TaxID=708113 RepID=A0A6S6QU31_9HYPH|nr:DNA-binding response regulator [Terrihabitans soli]BCJ90581.1 DNA-binding response regulator [Terrihabitans soli]
MNDTLHPRDIVLIVEDSVDNLGMLTQALEESGMTVLIAIDGDAALALVGEITPDIILMDAMMPGKDGFETTRLLKRSDSLSHVPVVFMTGLSETEHIVKGLEAGGVDYVTKPVAPDELVARIRVHLANARATQGARMALDASGRHLLAVNASGELLWATPQARRLLADRMTGVPDHLILPLAVRAWVSKIPGTNASPSPVTVETGPRKLQISFLARTGPDQFMLRLTEEDPESAQSALRDKLSLTNREAEVLLWLARGKSNKDIAEILGLSPRTVNKHLEQIYSKLGVENRASATAIATQAWSG